MMSNAGEKIYMGLIIRAGLVMSLVVVGCETRGRAGDETIGKAKEKIEKSTNHQPKGSEDLFQFSEGLEGK